MRTIVLGGAGYVGQVLVRSLHKSGHDVRVVDLFKFAPPTSLPRGVNWTMRDTRSLTPADFEGVDAVFDLAAISNDPSGELLPSFTRSVNVEARVRSARSAKQAGVGRYLLFSSCSVYGVNDNLVDEQSPLRPLTEYAVCNVEAEAEILPLADAGFCATAFRLATVFGPSPAMRFDLVVNTMSRGGFDTGKIQVTGGGEQFRPLVHVADIAAGALRVLELPTTTVNGEIFNLVHRNAQMRELAHAVAAGIGMPVEITIDASSIDQRNYRVNGDKARRMLDFAPARTPTEAAREIVLGLANNQLESGPLSIRLNGYRHLVDDLACTKA